MSKYEELRVCISNTTSWYMHWLSNTTILMPLTDTCVLYIGWQVSVTTVPVTRQTWYGPLQICVGLAKNQIIGSHTRAVCLLGYTFEWMECFFFFFRLHSQISQMKLLVPNPVFYFSLSDGQIHVWDDHYVSYPRVIYYFRHKLLYCCQMLKHSSHYTLIPVLLSDRVAHLRSDPFWIISIVQPMHSCNLCEITLAARE
jgi:hypothetical protein